MNDPLSSVLRHKGAVVHSVPVGATVAEAVRRMCDASIGALLVMEGSSIVGLFSERDVLKRVVDRGLDPRATPVVEVMTRSVMSVRPETTVDEAMSVMTEKHCRHLPVVQSGEPVGVVSIGDLTRWTVKGQSVAIQDLVEYIQGTYPR